MTPATSIKHGKKRYSYYVCSGAQKLGWKTCPSKSLPADQIEQFVLEQIRQVANNPRFLQGDFGQSLGQGEIAPTHLNATETPSDVEERRAWLSAILTSDWESQSTLEKGRFAQAMVEKVHYDGSKKKVSITFQASGLQMLAEALASVNQEKPR